MISRSGSLFLVRAARLPKTRPSTRATMIAIPPSFAEIGNDSPMMVEISRPVLVEIPMSPVQQIVHI